MEILVHNLSHADLILGVSTSKPGNDTTSNRTIVARPKFSEFNQISQQLYDRVKGSSDFQLELLHPECRPGGLPTLVEYDKVAAGYSLKARPVVCNINKLRFRNEDSQQHTIMQDSFHIENVYFPLLAVLIPKWLVNIRSNKHDRNRIVLVSGRGKPIDLKATDSDNSTEYTAQLAKLFLEKVYPEIEVQLLHSDTNLFRYDENIVFVKRELLPCINKFRDDLVTEFKGKWKENMRVTLSFADGTSARINAINASLRHFRPSYMHFWVLKSFWRERKIFEDDVECHTFEEIATEPAIHPKEADDPHIKMVVEEMNRFREEFAAILTNPQRDNDLGNFWLRKTKKPVLSVLLVEKNGNAKLYRGTNMEVSMPTGSLCAERNVIGSALADDVTLMREDIKIIAVYSVNVPILSKPLLDKVGAAELTISLACDSVDQCHVEKGGFLTKSPSTGHKRKIIHMPSSSTTSGDPSSTPKNIPNELFTTDVSGSIFSSSHKKSKIMKNIPFASPASHNDLSSLDHCVVINQGAPNIVPTMTTICVDDSDMNPLKPCGACNEWLKKIAEVNPNLRVVTFTDAQCKGIYIENIAD